MATNQQFKYGEWVSLPVPENTESGDPILIGSLPAVAQTDRGEGGNPSTHASVALDGSFRLSVTGSVDEGDPVFITGTNTLTATEGTNRLFGHALEAKGSGAGVIPVRLAGFSPEPDAS